jgi:hypothetical protein
MKDSQQRVATEKQDSHTFWEYVSTVLGVLSGASYFVSHALSFVLTILTIVSILIAIHLFMKEKGWVGTYVIPLALGIVALYVVVKVFDSFQNKKQGSSVTRAQPRDTVTVYRDPIQSIKTKPEEPKATTKPVKKNKKADTLTINVAPGGIGTINQQGNNTIINQAPPGRHLTKEQREIFRSFIATIPKESIGFMLDNPTNESRALFNDIVGILKESGWQYTGAGTRTSPEPMTGISISVKSEREAPLWAGQLQRILKSFFGDCPGFIDQHLDPSSILITIGQ